MQSSFYYFWRLIFVRKEIARIDWFVELNFMGYHLNRINSPTALNCLGVFLTVKSGIHEIHEHWPPRTMMA